MALMLLCLNSYSTSSDKQKQKREQEKNNKPRERSDYFDHHASIILHCYSACRYLFKWFPIHQIRSSILAVNRKKKKKEEELQ